MNSQIDAILEEMEESGDSQQLGVADCLRTIAGNGDEYGTARSLIACAEEIIDAAKYFIGRVREVRGDINRY